MVLHEQQEKSVFKGWFQGDGNWHKTIIIVAIILSVSFLVPQILKFINDQGDKRNFQYCIKFAKEKRKKEISYWEKWLQNKIDSNSYELGMRASINTGLKISELEFERGVETCCKHLKN